MDWLTRYVTGRNVILLFIGAILVRYCAMYYTVPKYWYERWRYPPVAVANSANADIAADLEQREAARVESRYRRLLAQLEQARSQGFEVRSLEIKARAVLALNVKEYRRRALKLLSEIEMQVPQKSVNTLPMNQEMGPGEQIEPDPQGRPAQAAPKTRRRAR